MRGFFFSSLFMGLLLLALNPFWVVAIQDEWAEFTQYNPYSPFERPEFIPRKPVTLPETDAPNADDLPRITDTRRIARNDPWIGDAPCGAEIFAAPETLPGVGPRQDGPLLTQSISASDRADIVNQPTFLYESDNGITLKLVQPVVNIMMSRDAATGMRRNISLTGSR